MIKNALDGFHRIAGLVFDAVRVIVLGDDVGMFVIERRRVAPEMNRRAHGLSTRIAGA